MSLEVIALRVRQDRAVSARRYYEGEATAISLQREGAVSEFVRLVKAYPNAYIAWFDERVESCLTDVAGWPELMLHRLEVLHLSCFQRCDRMAKSLGLVDFDSPFLLSGPTDRRFVTPLLSSIAGIAHAALLRALCVEDSTQSFALFMFDLGLRGAPAGVCPYSEPRLLARQIPAEAARATETPLTHAEMAALIRRARGRKWLVTWLLGELLLHRSLPLLSALKGCFKKAAPQVDKGALEALRPQVSDEVGDDAGAEIEVLMPTLGRPQCVADVLADLAAQTLLPKRVTIIEQQPDENACSLLSDLLIKRWPFTLTHHQVNWVGACRARNLGLSEARSEWVLLLDDDVRLTPNFLSYLYRTAKAYHVDGVNGAVYLPSQAKESHAGAREWPHIWTQFNTCVGLVSRRALEEAGQFDERLEGGYGEDYEFGVRLRMRGANIIYAPAEPTLHLKAATGGFRFVFPHPWRHERVQPKPSPTVLYSRHKHVTTAMRKGYQLFYWKNRLMAMPIHRWLWEMPKIVRQWRQAVKWSSWIAVQQVNYEKHQ